MLGLMFWEASREAREKAVLIKYNWIEKTNTSSVATLGYVAGEVPAGLMLLIVFTIWIPLILYANIRPGMTRTLVPIVSPTPSGHNGGGILAVWHLDPLRTRGLSEQI
jgi:hypothetical protein